MIFSQPLLKIMGVSIQMLYLMFLTILFSEAFQIFQVRSQFQYKYKTVAVLTVLLNISSIVFSLVLIYLMEDKLSGRLFGFSLPRVAIYAILFICVVWKGKGFDGSFCKYCLKISLPYIPHLLSLSILSASDRTMIKSMCGPEQTAIYSIGYSLVTLITLLGSSMNQAWTPWFGEQMHKHNYKSIQKWSSLYLLLFALLVMFVGLFAPEVILVMGGKSYLEAVNIIPPLLIGCVFQFAYTFYVNIESFEKRTGGLAIATTIAASANIILNYIFIPKFGYVAAAFTTLIGYAILFLIHFFMVWRMGFTKVYHTKRIVMILLLSLALSFGMYLMFGHTTIRFGFIGLFTLVLCGSTWKNRLFLLNIIHSISHKD